MSKKGQALRTSLWPTTALLWALGALLSLDQPASFAQQASGGAPKAAELTPACRAAQAYASLRDGAGIGSLFADQTDYMGPDGIIRHDAKEVTAFYTKMIAGYAGAGKPNSASIRVASLAPTGTDSCLLQFELKDATTEDFIPYGIDEFQVDRDVTKFRPYFLSAAIPGVHGMVERVSK